MYRTLVLILLLATPAGADVIWVDFQTHAEQDTFHITATSNRRIAGLQFSAHLGGEYASHGLDSYFRDVRLTPVTTTEPDHSDVTVYASGLQAGPDEGRYSITLLHTAEFPILLPHGLHPEFTELRAWVIHDDQIVEAEHVHWDGMVFIPEPTVLVLLGVGAAVLIRPRRRPSARRS